jgi:hypothetical protein
MPHLTHGAAVRRDRQLVRIRKLSLWLAGGAAAVSLGLGTAFAHALPGHSHPAAPSAGSQTGTRAGGAAPPQRASGRRPRPGSGQHRPHRLAPPSHRPGPARSPAPAPAPTQPVVSGGS